MRKHLNLSTPLCRKLVLILLENIKIRLVHCSVVLMPRFPDNASLKQITNEMKLMSRDQNTVLSLVMCDTYRFIEILRYFEI